MNVKELLARTSAAELADWRAFERIEGPLGPARTDFAAAVVACTIANVNRKKNAKPFKPKDFLPQWDRPGNRTPEQMRSFLIGLTYQLGGKVLEADQ